jgi:hypothetical protein
VSQPPEESTGSRPEIQPVLRIDPSLLVGRGGTRSCYLHPTDPEKCIKIDKKATRGPTAKEAWYYGKLSRLRPDLEYDFIPRFHGMIETDLGPGGVFDLVRDETTGEISKSLDHYIKAGDVSADDPVWTKAHNDFLQSVYHSAIVLRDFNAGNLCASHLADGGYRLVAIDGIGHRDFIPVCDHIRWAARRKVRRQIIRKHFGSLAEILNRDSRKRPPNPAG